MPAQPNNQNAVKDDADKASSFLYIRANPDDKSAWVKAASRAKKKLSKWVVESLNEKARG